MQPDVLTGHEIESSRGRQSARTDGTDRIDDNGTVEVEAVVYIRY